MTSIFALLSSPSSAEALADDIEVRASSSAAHSLFYSEYTDADYYRNTAVQDVDSITGDYYYWYKDDGLQRRANCYGYSFRLFYASKVFPNDVMITDQNLSYKQLPGEFANKSAGLDILDPSGSDEIVTSIFSMLDLSQFYYDTIYNTAVSQQNRMNYFVQLLRADAAKLGYTLQEYTGTAIPDCSSITNKRMIAVVLTNSSYHFYMQHSDNTWSHKDGTSQPRNTCFTHSTPLTNSIIRSHVCEGTYANGQVKFFYITKKSIIDCGHLNGSSSSATTTSLATSDGAGNNFETATNLTSWASQSRTGYIDYVDDVDCYYATAPKNGSFTFSLSSNNSVAKTVELYLSDGTLLTSKSFTTGTTSFSFPLVKNNTFILKISTSGQAVHQYGYTYTFTVSS
jgi:hypothetical protein